MLGSTTSDYNVKRISGDEFQIEYAPGTGTVLTTTPWRGVLAHKFGNAFLVSKNPDGYISVLLGAEKSKTVTITPADVYELCADILSALEG